jgi:hypothetical protein
MKEPGRSSLDLLIDSESDEALFSEMPVNLYQTARRYIPEDSTRDFYAIHKFQDNVSYPHGSSSFYIM